MSKHNDILATFAFLATLLVVMCHADDVMTPKTLPVAILGGTFSDANVYNFFWLSGYFLGRHLEEKHWWSAALFKRISTLLVPYVMWCVLYFVIRALAGTPDSIDYPIGFEGIDKLFGILRSCPACFPMWYIKTLYLFIFAAPVFTWGLMRFRSTGARMRLMSGVVILYACAKYFGLTELRYFNIGGFKLLGFVFFCGGLWLSQIRMKNSWLEAIRARAWCVAVGALGVWILSAVWAHYHGWWYEMNILISSACLFLIACIIRKSPLVLTRNSFFIYGSHLIMLSYLGRRLAGGGIVASLALYALLTIGVTCVAIIGGEIMRRVVPTLYAPLVGGRT